MLEHELLLKLYTQYRESKPNYQKAQWCAILKPNTQYETWYKENRIDARRVLDSKLVYGEICKSETRDSSVKAWYLYVYELNLYGVSHKDICLYMSLMF